MKQPWSAMADEAPLPQIQPEVINNNRYQQMMKNAAAEVQESYRLLDKAGLNIVGEVLKGQGTFYEMDHYPKDDVYDNQTFSQYYYHAHRNLEEEHGHFHTFIRAKGFPSGVLPAAGFKMTEPWPDEEDAICHFVGISMDSWGFPTGLFSTNRWVTGETWFSGSDVIQMIDRFKIDHAHPNLVINHWITAMLQLYRPYIEALLTHRDQVITCWADKYKDRDVLEDRELEVIGYYPISSKDLIPSF